MKTLKILLLILLLCSTVRVFPEETRIYSYTYYITATDERTVTDAIQKLAHEKGGYLKNLSTGQLSIRMAPGYNDELKSLFVKTGYILDERLSREDAGEKMVDLATRLSVKEKLLKELYALFNASHFHQTLEVEKEIGRLIVEIEEIKGQMAFYRDRIALSEFTIHLNVIPPSVKKGSEPPRWQWVNSLGIPGLLQEVQDEN